MRQQEGWKSCVSVDEILITSVLQSLLVKKKLPVSRFAEPKQIFHHVRVSIWLFSLCWESLGKTTFSVGFEILRSTPLPVAPYLMLRCLCSFACLSSNRVQEDGLCDINSELLSVCPFSSGLLKKCIDLLMDLCLFYMTAVQWFTAPHVHLMGLLFNQITLFITGLVIHLESNI